MQPRRREAEEPPPNPDPPLARQANNTVSGAAMERGLPAAIEAEKFILGSILLNDERYVGVSAVLAEADFHVEKHRRIYARMKDLHDRSERINRITVANALMKQGQLESVDGLSYLSSLDDGGLDDVNLDSYLRIVKEKSLHRQLIRVSSKFAKSSLLETDDVRNILSGLGAEIQRLQDEAHAGEEHKVGRTPIEVIENYPGGSHAFFDPSARLKGIQTGFTKLDDLTGGFFPGQLITLSGLTASGKTAFALNIAENLVFRSVPVPTLIITLEMPDWSLLNRMVASRACVHSYRIRNNFLNKEERDRMRVAAMELTEVPGGAVRPLYISQEGENIDAVCGRIRRGVKKHNLGFVVIDHLGLIESDDNAKNITRALEVSRWTRKLKLLAVRLGIPILMLAQMSRGDKQNSGKRHTLKDLKDSGSIEQDSNIVMFTYREWLGHRDRSDLKDKAEILLEKNRDGEVGIVPLVFRGGFTRFMNPDDEGANDSGEP